MLTTIIIVLVLAAAVWFGAKVGMVARCPHCGFVPKGTTARIAPVCQRCGKEKRSA